MKDRDAADYELLSLANEKGQFAMEFAKTADIEFAGAFQRGLDGDWFTLVDVAPLSHFRNKIFRVFKLTQAGRDRLAALQTRVHQ